MRNRKLKELWRNDGVVFNGWLSMPSSVSAEVMAHQGLDSLTIDIQHGLIDYQVAVQMLQAISTTDTLPIVRLGSSEAAHAAKILDAGAMAIICPNINNKQDAEALVRACRYPPAGSRSWSRVRADLYAGANYFDRAGSELVIMPMIETPEAIQNLDGILSVDGIDAVYVGPGDLGVALGLKPGLDRVEPTLVDSLKKIVNACRRHNVVAGIHTTSIEYALRMIADGYRFITVSSDFELLSKAKAVVSEIRSKKST